MTEGLVGFSRREAERVVSNRVCALCWSELNIVDFDGELNVQVFCPGCGKSVEETGHISKNTPSIMMENAKYTYNEVKSNLRDLFPKEPNAPKTEQEIMQSLGF